MSIVIAGLAMRLVGFGNSLWIDEFSTLWAVEGSLHDTWTRAIAFHSQTPFYYILEWLPVHVFGESAASLRLLSLCSVSMAALAVWRAGVWLHSSRAGMSAACLFWLSEAAIAHSANARPYALALLFAALMMLGFARTLKQGDTKGRILWVSSAILLVWTHFLAALLVFSILVVYALFPHTRERYRARCFIADLAVLVAFGALTVMRVADLFSRRHVLSWILQADHAGIFIEVLGPFLIAALLGIRTATDHERRARLMCIVMALSPILILELLFVGGLNLIVQPYAVVAIVPAALAAGIGLAGGGTRATKLIGTAMFALVTTISFIVPVAITHTFTGTGMWNWEGAVGVLESELGRDTQTPVLYRSGFVEDDLVVSTTPNPGTRSPLRLPGHPAPAWRIVQLTYRWSAPGREEFFARTVAPAIDNASKFYVLTQRNGTPTQYFDDLDAWIEARWPGRYERVILTTHPSVALVQYRRLP